MMQDKPLVVNLFGGPGTGKSTGAAHIFAGLKLAGINCELVTEHVKKMVWYGRTKEIQSQYYIFGKQHHKILMLQDQVDVIVTDSPLLLNLVYGNRSKEFDSLIWKAHWEFNNVNYFLHRMKTYIPSGRLQTESEAEILDDTILNTLETEMEPFHTCFANVSGYNEITKEVIRILT